jgi:hypothetical protein
MARNAWHELAALGQPTKRREVDLSGIDPTELRLEVLAILDERHIGPEFRRAMKAQFGAAIDAAGGAPEVLREAISRIREGRAKKGRRP